MFEQIFIQILFVDVGFFLCIRKRETRILIHRTRKKYAEQQQKQQQQQLKHPIVFFFSLLIRCYAKWHAGHNNKFPIENQANH